MKITTIGLDLAKTVFHVVGLDERGKEVMRRKLRRGQVAAYFAKLPACRVGMEACGGCKPSLGMVPSWQGRLSARWAMPRPFGVDGTSRRYWAWCRPSTAAVARPGCWGSARVRAGYSKLCLT